MRRLMILAALVAISATVPGAARADHGAITHNGELDVTFTPVGSCIRAELVVRIVSIPVGIWSDNWAVQNDYSTPSGGGFESTSGAHSTYTVIIGGTHTHAVYDKCFPAGSHGYLSIQANVSGLALHHEEFACHWGHLAGQCT